jgi:hypothetical protein
MEIQHRRSAHFDVVTRMPLGSTDARIEQNSPVPTPTRSTCAYRGLDIAAKRF